jgi:hypothetical protein
MYVRIVHAGATNHVTLTLEVRSFLMSGHSWNPLFLTLPMLRRIMTYHQVMSAYLDFVSVFGHQSRPRDLRFSGFREETVLSDPPRGLMFPDLGRSGRLFQLCYNLKAPAPRDDQKTIQSIRQAAIHHQFDAVEGTSLWIIAKGDDLLKTRIEQMTGPRGRPEDRTFTTVAECFRSSLAVHLLLCNWSTEEWRWYIQSFEDIIDRDVTLSHCGRGSKALILQPRPSLQWSAVGNARTGE